MDKLKKIKEIAVACDERDKKVSDFRRENSDWLIKSTFIALEIREQLRLQSISKEQFAEMLGVSLERVEEIISGEENFDLATINKIEKILNTNCSFLSFKETVIGKRQDYNLKCLNLLLLLIENYPDWRFMQLLFNIGLCEDRFYEESIDTYNKLEEISKQHGIRL
jgi:transcriptional regulator with XRE-family HTH domain